MLLARKLLQLVACSQQLDYSFPNPIRAMEGRYLELVSQVTGNEKLLDSLEGLECLCLEALVTVMCSNLRKGLFIARRAVTLAQFMGIHKGCPRPLKVLDPSATRATPSGIWTRIVWLERYLSLLLGFPSSIPGNVFACYPPQAEVSNNPFLPPLPMRDFTLHHERTEKERETASLITPSSSPIHGR